VHSHKKNGGKLPSGFAPGCQNVFCFFVLSMQRGLSVTYPALISTMFETTDVNRFYFGASWTCFLVIASPNWNLCGWNLDYKWRATVRTDTSKTGEIASGFRPKVPKRVLFFCIINATRPCGHLSCTDFDHFWNNRRDGESLCACVHRLKIFQFLHGVFQVPKQPKIRYFGVGCLW